MTRGVSGRWLVWLAAAGLVLAAAPSQAASLAEVKRRGELRVGADPSAGQPYFASGAGGYVGFEADMARAIARRLGVKVVFVPTAWPKLLGELAGDRFDVVLNAVEVAPKAGVRFSTPYYTASQALLVKQSERRIGSMDDLAGRSVGTLDGSVAAAVLTHLPRQPQVKPFPDTLAPFKALANNQVDAVLLESAMVRWQAHQQPGQFRVVGQPVLARPYGIAAREKDASLVEGLNEALRTMRAQGELKQLLTGYGLWDSAQDESRRPAD